jgi:hypothetical protein
MMNGVKLFSGFSECRYFSVVQRLLSSRRGNKMVRKETPGDSQPPLPNFSDLMRDLYKKGHPDVLRSIDKEKADINDQSFQILNNIITTIKTPGYPPMMVKTIPFHLKTTKGTKSTNLHVKTAGGECKRQLSASFEEFFITSGINPTGKFRWGNEHFPVDSLE